MIVTSIGLSGAGRRSSNESCGSPGQTMTAEQGHSRYLLRCMGCGSQFVPGRWILHCTQCQHGALLRTEYAGPLELSGESDRFASYASWLPYENELRIDGPTLATVAAPRLAQSIGLKRLWVIVSGFAPVL